MTPLLLPYMKNETIAAISTSLNEAGIGIIRISGDESFKIADSIYVNKDMKHTLLSFSSHTIHYGFIVDNSEVYDEVMVSVMKAPNTFTKEDVVEINCHGGILVCKKILDLVLRKGARLSEPGEFTKRAFLNGRIDLSKAEAVMDLISSKNNSSLKNSLKLLSGKLYDEIKSLREKLLYEIAFIESAIDDPENYSLDGYDKKLDDSVSEVMESINRLLKSFEKGKFIKEGISTVIVGKPNVGKSSLLNLLCGEDRAIVTDIAGTTRDIIETNITVNDISLNLTDTAGIRDTKDYVENIGVDRAKNYAKEADLVLFVLDGSSNLDKEDLEIIDFIKDKNVIVLLNKSDKGNIIDRNEVLSKFSKVPEVLNFSALSGTGEDELFEIIRRMFFNNEISTDDEVMITRERQRALLNESYESLKLVRDSISKALPEDFYSIDLLNAYQALGRIIGEEVDDDVVEEIFSKFCMGK